mmetsp:Transcript_811/g.986  ORF Transcript_811/g.986 Transcript_811/m.986 type:complete len:228 (+) Transcript_811:110-793(+)
MSLKVDADCSTTVEEVRSDKSELNWVALKYEGKAKLMVGGKGSGGFAEFKAYLPDDQCTWGFLRVMGGDQESKRPKFVMVQYNGPSLAGMAKSRAGSQKPDVEKIMGQHHVFYFTDDPEDMTEEEVMAKVKKSSGANYDLGSNAKGYESKAGEIKNTSKSMYLEKEKETNITKPVVFFEGALAHSTPCDLSGRPTVAPPTDARKNTDLKGKLNIDKWTMSSKENVKQ